MISEVGHQNKRNSARGEDMIYIFAAPFIIYSILHKSLIKNGEVSQAELKKMPPFAFPLPDQLVS